MQMYKYAMLVFLNKKKKLNDSSGYTWKSDHMCSEKTNLSSWLQSYPKLCLPSFFAIIEDNQSKTVSLKNITSSRKHWLTSPFFILSQSWQNY